MRTFPSFLTLACALWIAACGGDSASTDETPAIDPGVEGGECLEGGSCTAPLLCIEQVCVDDAGLAAPGLAPAEDDIVFADNVYFIGDDSPIGIVEVYDDGSVDIAASGDEPLPDLQPGDILLSPPEKGGIVGKITEINDTGAVLEVFTEPPGLTEIFKEGSLRVTQEIDFSDWDFEIGSFNEQDAGEKPDTSVTLKPLNFVRKNWRAGCLCGHQRDRGRDDAQGVGQAAEAGAADHADAGL